MSAALSHAPAEASWKVYVRGLALVAPGLVIWALIQTKGVPVLVEICHNSLHPAGENSWLWDISMLAVRFGFDLLLIAVAALALLEWFSPAWRRHRELGITSFAWLVNLAVIMQLAALFIAAMVTVPHLLK